MSSLNITKNDALLIVDVQNDFCSQGSLAVMDGEQIIPLINKITPHFHHIVLTQDWHPASHVSFASQHQKKKVFDEIQLSYGAQTLWPDHCVQNTFGAQFHKDLNQKSGHIIIRKGFHPTIDSYSAFYENDHKTPTGLSGYLKTFDIERVFLVGLALDFCVRYSALDSKTEGFQTIILEDATRPVALGHSLQEAYQSFDENNIELMRTTDL